jgi:hypothetical protein
VKKMNRNIADFNAKSKNLIDDNLSNMESLIKCGKNAFLSGDWEDFEYLWNRSCHKLKKNCVVILDDIAKSFDYHNVRVQYHAFLEKDVKFWKIWRKDHQVNIDEVLKFKPMFTFRRRVSGLDSDQVLLACVGLLKLYGTKVDRSSNNKFEDFVHHVEGALRRFKGLVFGNSIVTRTFKSGSDFDVHLTEKDLNKMSAGNAMILLLETFRMRDDFTIGFDVKVVSEQHKAFLLMHEMVWKVLNNMPFFNGLCGIVRQMKEIYPNIKWLPYCVSAALLEVELPFDLNIHETEWFIVLPVGDVDDLEAIRSAKSMIRFIRNNNYDKLVDATDYKRRARKFTLRDVKRKEVEEKRKETRERKERSSKKKGRERVEIDLGL